MPIPVTCGGCGRHIEAPDSLAGVQVTCKQCGAPFTVPAAESAAEAPLSAAKTCVSCGIDVSRSKRAKDARGNYYCEACWTARAQPAKPPTPRAASTPPPMPPAMKPVTRGAAAPPLPPVPPTARAGDEIVHYPCSVCETLFTIDEVYDQGSGRVICKACHETQQADPSTQPPPAATNAAAAEELFCEGCNRLFPPDQLKLSPGGAVLCKKCMKSRGRAA